ncbi:helicase-related protein [Cohnella sp. AR92]|uniref:helicase-related protein n=1 Tax=Cohnella sp. AR92 TaxID=648716 RepID=UPI0013151653|nr:helicase-related protein [Cohnella sp. AR92]
MEITREDGRTVCWLREPMPLGIAEESCRLFNFAGKRGDSRTPDQRAMSLRQSAESAWDAAGEKGVSVLVTSRSEGEREKNAEWRKANETEWEVLSAAAEQAGACLQGRSLLREEAMAMLAKALPTLREREPLQALQLSALRGAVRLAAAIAPRAAGSAGSRRRQGLRCRRCGSGEERMRRTRCASCGRSGCAVCEACAALGRSRECELLVLGAEQPGTALAALPPAFEDRWGLSPAQRSAAEAAYRFLRAVGEAPASIAVEPCQPLACSQHLATQALRLLRRMLASLALTSGRSSHADHPARSFLLWAVTGAGKTEMIFPLLDAVLRAGGRALIATPRRDVVLELAPRLLKAFPDVRQAVLYGGSEDRWTNAPLTIATTHQLMRFQHSFDLVLVDELDAFPYHNDPVLHYAADKARRRHGATVLLSATPPAKLRQRIRRGQAGCARVPVRYHRHPLPVPQRLSLPPLSKLVQRRELPRALLAPITVSVRRGAQVFVFVPYIKHVLPVVGLLRRAAPALGIRTEEIAGTYSSDPERASKVQDFRQKKLRLLVTTTILERGVTIPKSDVFILGAHQSTFDDASLVQMAGRAGRSADDPFGRVYFGSPYLTLSQRQACRQIRAMNRMARRRGYLRQEGERA